MAARKPSSSRGTSMRTGHSQSEYQSSYSGTQESLGRTATHNHKSLENQTWPLSQTLAFRVRQFFLLLFEWYSVCLEYVCVFVYSYSRSLTFSFLDLEASLRVRSVLANSQLDKELQQAQ